MNNVNCPWCETALQVFVDDADEQRCPECLTAWRYEDEDASELALAA